MPHRALPIAAASAVGAPGNIDPAGRTIDYLRLSVTDRCNLRCVYCMPSEGVPLAPRHELLSLHDILRLAQAAYAVGFRKFRVTGGEPLVVRGLLPFLGALRATVPGALLCLTTNGTRLQESVGALRSAGVQRLNISLDSLRPERFALLARRDQLHAVLSGLNAAVAAGFERVKVNVVVIPGQNDDELVDLARLAERLPVDVRFIEQMPQMGQVDPGYLASRALQARLQEHLALRPTVPEDVRAAAVDMHQVAGWPGRIAFISPRSAKFCAQCNRLRLTSRGELKGCLLQAGTVDVRVALRAGASDMHLQELVRLAIAAKPPEYEDSAYGLDRPMSGLGG